MFLSNGQLSGNDIDDLYGSDSDDLADQQLGSFARSTPAQRLHQHEHPQQHPHQHPQQQPQSQYRQARGFSQQPEDMDLPSMEQGDEDGDEFGAGVQFQRAPAQGMRRAHGSSTSMASVSSAGSVDSAASGGGGARQLTRAEKLAQQRKSRQKRRRNRNKAAGRVQANAYAGRATESPTSMSTHTPPVSAAPSAVAAPASSRAEPVDVSGSSPPRLSARRQAQPTHEVDAFDVAEQRRSQYGTRERGKENSDDGDYLGAVDPASASRTKRLMEERGISPTYDPGTPDVPSQSVSDDVRSFVTTPVPRRTNVQLYICRNKTGLAHRMFPLYEIYHQDGTLLMRAKKQPGNKTSNYHIFFGGDGDLSKRSPHYLGKVRSNFVGTNFMIYSAGLNPRSSGSAAHSPSLVRQELGSVQYDSNILGSRGPRRMTVHLPAVTASDEVVTWRPLGDDSGMQVAVEKNQLDGLFRFTNRKPTWNDELGAYVLNFNGRVTEASVKNFQMVCPEIGEDEVLLQFGRVEKNKFNVDLRWPFSPLQAFAICLSSFDYKLACE